MASFRQQVRDREGIGPGPALQFGGGVEFWDQLIVGLDIGVYGASDDKPFSEAVIECDQFNMCGAPKSAESSITGSGFLALETGYQRRLRPWDTSSFSLGLVGGYFLPFASHQRKVGNCDDCTVVAVDTCAAGAYLAPFLRVTFGDVGNWAMIVRSRWFVSGDLAQMTLLGVEGGVP